MEPGSAGSGEVNRPASSQRILQRMSSCSSSILKEARGITQCVHQVQLALRNSSDLEINHRLIYIMNVLLASSVPPLGPFKENTSGREGALVNKGKVKACLAHISGAENPAERRPGHIRRLKVTAVHGDQNRPNNPMCRMTLGKQPWKTWGTQGAEHKDHTTL